MVRKLEALVKKHKKVGKPILIGKVLGVAGGVAIGDLVGKEILEFFNLDYSRYILFGVKLSPMVLLGYVGQVFGGWTGIGYYFLNRTNRNYSQSL